MHLQAAEVSLWGRLSPFLCFLFLEKELALPGPQAELGRLEARTPGRSSGSGWEGQTALWGPRGPSPPVTCRKPPCSRQRQSLRTAMLRPRSKGDGGSVLDGWGRGTSRRAPSHQRRAGWSRWTPSPIQGTTQHDPVTPLGSRCLGVPGCPVCGAGRGARRGQTLPEVRALGGRGGDGDGAQRPSQGLPRAADAAGATSPGPLW